MIHEGIHERAQASDITFVFYDINKPNIVIFIIIYNYLQLAEQIADRRRRRCGNVQLSSLQTIFAKSYDAEELTIARFLN
jgi:hypothetical protein